MAQEKLFHQKRLTTNTQPIEELQSFVYINIKIVWKIDTFPKFKIRYKIKILRTFDWIYS